VRHQAYILTVFGLCAICSLLVFAVRGHILRRRRRSVQRYARRHGYQFSPKDPYRLTESQLPLLRRGDNRTCSNVVTGQRDGLAFVAADYVYQEAEVDIRGASRGPRYQYKLSAIVVAALDPRLRLPTTIISRRVVPVPLGRHAGLREVWSGHEPFDRRFRVEVADGADPARVVHSGLMRYLLALPPIVPVFRWELTGSQLLLSTAPRSAFAPENLSTEDMLMEYIEPLLAAAADFARNLAASAEFARELAAGAADAAGAPQPAQEYPR
jgi:hypothetical protein